MTKAEKEKMNDEFMKTLMAGLQLTNIQADMLEANMSELDKKMTKLDDDLNETNINASYQAIERYCFQKSYTLTSEEFLSDLGKFRRGKQKQWQQINVNYVDEIHAKEFYHDDYPSLSGEYVYDNTQLTSTKNKAYAIDCVEDNLTRSQSTFIKSVLGLGVEATKHNLELSAKSFNNRLNRTIKAIENKSNKYEIVSERETKINSKLDIINKIVHVIESEDSNEIRIYKALVVMSESSIGYLYNKAFNSVDKEIALQLFKENDGKKYAYQLVNVLYAEKEKLEMKLVA